MASQTQSLMPETEVGWLLATRSDGYIKLEPNVTPLKDASVRGSAQGLLNSESEASHAHMTQCPMTLGWSLHFSEIRVLYLPPGKHRLQ